MSGDPPKPGQPSAHGAAFAAARSGAVQLCGYETMPLNNWMFSDGATRVPVRRTRGRRASDRRSNLEAVLVAMVVVAWGWGAYELAQLFLP